MSPIWVLINNDINKFERVEGELIHGTCMRYQKLLLLFRTHGLPGCVILWYFHKKFDSVIKGVSYKLYQKGITSGSLVPYWWTNKAKSSIVCSRGESFPAFSLGWSKINMIQRKRGIKIFVRFCPKWNFTKTNATKCGLTRRSQESVDTWRGFPSKIH